MSDRRDPSPAVRFLVGDRVYLRPIEAEDLSLVRRWSNDPEIRRLTGEATPMGKTDGDEFLERVRTDKERVWFAVVLKEHAALISGRLGCAATGGTASTGGTTRSCKPDTA